MRSLLINSQIVAAVPNAHMKGSCNVDIIQLLTGTGNPRECNVNIIFGKFCDRLILGNLFKSRLLLVITWTLVPTVLK